MIILDVGEGTALNQAEFSCRRIAAICAETGFPKDQLIIKPQLFEYEPPNKPLLHEVFQDIYMSAVTWGFQCTASIFDKPSLDFLLTFDVPFVKIANRPYLRKFIALVPRGIEVVVSVGSDDLPPAHSDWARIWPHGYQYNLNYMFCSSKYPASIADYEVDDDMECSLRAGISDHTVGLDLWRRYKPRVYEKHFALSGMNGPSIGPWALDEDGLRTLLSEAAQC